MRVAIIRRPDARRQSDEVVAVVPLRTLDGAGIATRLDHAQIFGAQGLDDDVDEGLLLAAEVEPALALALAGAQRDR